MAVKKSAKTKGALQGKQALSAAVKSLEKTKDKLELDLQKVKKHLAIRRWYRS
jgi:hypothetical protein